MAETIEGLQMVFGKKEIEDAIIDANKEKLQQANNMPFRMEPLQSLLGEQMEYEKWEKILKKEMEEETQFPVSHGQSWHYLCRLG